MTSINNINHTAVQRILNENAIQGLDCREWLAGYIEDFNSGKGPRAPGILWGISPDVAPTIHLVHRVSNLDSLKETHKLAGHLILDGPEDIKSMIAQTAQLNTSVLLLETHGSYQHLGFDTPLTNKDDLKSIFAALPEHAQIVLLSCNGYWFGRRILAEAVAPRQVIGIEGLLYRTNIQITCGVNKGINVSYVEDGEERCYAIQHIPKWQEGQDPEIFTDHLVGGPEAAATHAALKGMTIVEMED